MKYAFSFGLIVVGLVLLWLALSGRLAKYAQVITNTADALNAAQPGTTVSPTSAIQSGQVGQVPITVAELQQMIPSTPIAYPPSWGLQPTWPGTQVVTV